MRELFYTQTLDSRQHCNYIDGELQVSKPKKNKFKQEVNSHEFLPAFSLTASEIKEAKSIAMIHLINLKGVIELVESRLHDNPFLDETSLSFALDELRGSLATIQSKFDKEDILFLKRQLK